LPKLALKINEDFDQVQYIHTTKQKSLLRKSTHLWWS